jgi:glycosyltransferase involved in cell wall biosynthesis
MLQFFHQLSQNNEHAKLFFISKDNPEMIYAQAEKIGIAKEKIIIKGANREEVPYFLSLTNVGLFFIKPVFSKKASSPTKQGEMMGMGIPIICNDIGDTGRIVEETGVGVVVENFSTIHLKSVVAKVGRISKIDQQLIRNSAFKYYSLTEGVKNYAKVYQKVLQHS